MEFLKKNKDKIYKIIKKILLIVIFMTTLINFVIEKGLWVDELDWAIGIIQNNNLKNIYLTVLEKGENLPLFYFVLFFFYKIFGLKEDILTFLVATIPTLIGLWGLMKISRKFFNRKVELLVIFLSWTNYAFMVHSAWQLRPYGLLFCFSAWSLYFYLRRLEKENYTNIIKYGICMIFLLYTHWFGSLIALCYAFIDFILFIKKKVKLKSIISYIIAGLAFLPSFIVMLYLHQGDIGSYGVATTGLWEILDVINFLNGNSIIGILVLILVVVEIIIQIIKKKTNIYINIITVSSLMLFFGTIVYSILINPEGTIVRSRYYITILPHVILMLSYVFSKVMEELVHNNKFETSRFIASILILVLLLFEIVWVYFYMFYAPNSLGSVNALYQERAEYMITQEDIYNDDTLIMCSFGKAWVEYYFSCQGVDLPSNVIVVDPLDYPNTKTGSEVDINSFEYCVKDGELVDNVAVEDILQYDTIYYMPTYRILSSELQEKLIENYYLEEVCDMLYKCVKIDENVN